MHGRPDERRRRQRRRGIAAAAALALALALAPHAQAAAGAAAATGRIPTAFLPGLPLQQQPLSSQHRLAARWGAAGTGFASSSLSPLSLIHSHTQQQQHRSRGRGRGQVEARLSFRVTSKRLFNKVGEGRPCGFGVCGVDPSFPN